jgi:Ca-activated chloride channel family protein
MSGRMVRMVAAAPLFAVVVMIALGSGGAAGGRASALPDTLKTEPVPIRIDLDKAVAIKIPDRADLKAMEFKTSDNRSGWAVKIPGGRPIATPAYADGMIFVGGGYGSYEFYAFDAATGKKVWSIKTADDGPSAAVVEDGYVAFNTESCTVIVVQARTGKLVWQEWLGDPLMSQPAIANGRLYIAHPNSSRSQQGNNVDITPQQDDKPTSHNMLCADLKTGKHIWSRGITSDVISAPVADSGKLFFTCFDGTSYCLDAATGSLVWKKENAGTSAPIIVDGQVMMTTKEDREGQVYEGILRIGVEHGVRRDSAMLAPGEAGYLEKNRGGGVGLQADDVAKLDQSVGFSTAPSSAGLAMANDHIGVNTVAGGWAYQGSRATYSRGQIMNAQGRYINNVASADGKVSWRAEAVGKGVAETPQLFAPPSVGGNNLYLCTVQGHIASVRQKDGHTNFMYNTGHPATFQPALAGGNMYVGTADGWIICLKTGERDADGWYAWGGNAQHNKKN